MTFLFTLIYTYRYLGYLEVTFIINPKYAEYRMVYLLEINYFKFSSTDEHWIESTTLIKKYNRLLLNIGRLP